jgi:hypothetical protein
LSPFQLFDGRFGRAAKPPPQFGQTLPNTASTQELQKVHSNVQIIASVDSGGSILLQFSHVGLSSSMDGWLLDRSSWENDWVVVWPHYCAPKRRFVQACRG